MRRNGFTSADGYVHLQAERRGQFDSNSDVPRPDTPEKILHHRLLHNSMPDDARYSLGITVKIIQTPLSMCCVDNH